MITREQASILVGRAVHDRDGDRIGTLDQVWADRAGHPAWAQVRTDASGDRGPLVPLQDADVTGDGVRLSVDAATAHRAPRVDVAEGAPLPDDDDARLAAHYGLSRDTSAEAYRAGAQDAAQATGDDAMTRSEERLTVGTEREHTGDATLRKYVETEREEVRVPVSHEEVRLEREPITDANRDDAYAGPEIGEAEHQVALHAERPVVDTETVPVERVRLGTQTVTEEETVSGEVRKERIEADLPEQGRHRLG